jgi:hypothetical protein
MTMQLNATTTWWLNFLLVAIQGLSTVAWNTMGVDPKWIALITQVVGYTSILLNFAIHGSVPGIAPVQMTRPPIAPQK